MRLVFFAIILGVIMVVPYGIWLSIGIFSSWFIYKLWKLDIRIEIIHKDQYNYDTLKEMK